MIDGLVVVDKAPGWTSHDVVAKCRGIFGQRRIGHSGTLDPDATGVLLVGLGRVTRLLRFLTDLPKTYTAEVVLGVATSTLDASGEVVAEWDMSGIRSEDVRVAAGGLTGPILQVPPMVSAVQVGGRRLHELARAGVEVEREARPVTVHRFVVVDTDEPLVFGVEVQCSSGTYIRTLAADLGTALGGGAHLRNLRRTAIGSFTEAQAVPLEELAAESVLPPAEALRDYPSVQADAGTAEAVGYGRPLADLPAGVVRVVAPDGALLGVYDDGRPAVVLAGA
ncbi:MAG: tRNA pseudouridine(55) synthase TruB [Actinobacteria bacterium]|nr:tRNA pseudouridine(55) synthase TruB [Actinomycetota bacterium]MBW3651850.1 tRNA pseudouridine(55) synthase TruB [Actinomycetota bacterium]